MSPARAHHSEPRPTSPSLFAHGVPVYQCTLAAPSSLALQSCHSHLKLSISMGPQPQRLKCQLKHGGRND